MLANLLWAGVLLLQGQQGGEVGWDLVTMWHNMGIPGEGRRRRFFSSCPRGPWAS